MIIGIRLTSIRSMILKNALSANPATINMNRVTFIQKYPYWRGRDLPPLLFYPNDKYKFLEYLNKFIPKNLHKKYIDTFKRQGYEFEKYLTHVHKSIDCRVCYPEDPLTLY